LFLGRVGLAVAVLWALKRLVHDLHLDVLRVDPLFIALILSTLVLLAVLLQGVLSDFRESERLPAEAATILEMLSLEILAISAHNDNDQAQISQHQRAVTGLAEALVDWLLAKISTAQIHQVYQECFHNTVAATLLLRDQPVLQGRLIQQMENLLRIINRINTIRETSFVASVYWLAWLGTALMCAGLVFTQLNSPLESSVFLLVVSFVLLFMIHLISDLDNPFGFNDVNSAEDVCLDPLLHCVQRLHVAPKMFSR
jgi:hypothetical protein